MSPRTKLLIVDDQPIYAKGLKYIIESRTSEFEVLDIAANGLEALSKIREAVPDIVLMDVRMPVMDGVVATREIGSRYPDVKILILTTFDDDEYVRRSMQHGAVGYLLKNRPPDELIASIRALNRGIMQIDPAVSGKLFQTSHQQDQSEEILELLRTLTTREREVLRLLVRTKKIAQIAGELGIAEQTVRNHNSNIYSKLRIHNRLEIIRYINQIHRFIDTEV